MAKLSPRSIGAALLDVKEVKPGTKLPNNLWEADARVLAGEVKRLRKVLTMIFPGSDCCDFPYTYLVLSLCTP